MNLTGKIVEIFDTNQIKETFKKREFVVEYADNPSYPELIKMEFIQMHSTTFSLKPVALDN